MSAQALGAGERQMARSRAYSRAYSRLADLHPALFGALLEEEMAIAEAEVLALREDEEKPVADIHYTPDEPREPFCGTLAEGELHGTPDPAKVTCIACRALILAADSPQGRQS